MCLPTLIGGLTSLGVIILLFYKDLKTPVPQTHGFNKADTHGTVKHKAPLVVALIHLLACIILLAVSDFIHVEMWIICVLLALSLTVFDLIYDITVEKTVIPVVRSLRKEPYELIPFVLSMFIIVLALKERGATALLNEFLISGNKADGIFMGFLSAVSANFLNNIPMSVLFESIINGESFPALYGAVIGSNIGAFITPVGALAGIMWNKILVRYGVKLSFAKFVLYGVAVAIPTLTTTLLTLFLVL
jgi:arsenical pump membrane protein